MSYIQEEFSDLLAFWGDDLVRWRGDDLAGLRISKGAQEFLTEIGFPGDVDWTLRFTPHDIRFVPGIEDSLIIGDDTDYPIFIEPSTEHIRYIDHRGLRFMNSSLGQMARFLMVYQDYRLRVRDLDEDDQLDEINEIIDVTERRMSEIDALAMSREDGYWPSILEQMREGFL